MHSQQTHLVYEFGDFELDALRRVLVSRTDGQQVEVTGRVLEALVYFVERPGQLIDKRALIEALWPHVIVEDGSLTQTIHTLRRALGERPGEHRYIATVPGRGYRFVADVNVRAAQAKSDAAYDRGVQDVFGVQREIASAVAEALRITFDRGNGPRRAETSSAQAYERYLQGRHLFHRRTGSDLLRAKTHFEEAIRADPDYARAWAGLAGVYFVAHYENLELPDAMSKWGQAAQRAVALAPDLAEANVRAAQYYWHIGDSDPASMHVARAIAMDPADPLVVSLSLSRAIIEGRMKSAVELQRRMIATDPLSASHHSNLGMMLTMTGDLDEAHAELERALELGPAAVFAIHDIAYVLILQRRIDEALSVIHQLPAGYHRDLCFALAYIVRGDTANGDAMLARLLALGEAPDADSAVAFAIAEVYAVKNDPDQAFKWLDLARRRLENEGVPLPGAELRQNVYTAPFLKPLHADPRWDELLVSADAQ